MVVPGRRASASLVPVVRAGGVQRHGSQLWFCRRAQGLCISHSAGQWEMGPEHRPDSGDAASAATPSSAAAAPSKQNTASGEKPSGRLLWGQTHSCNLLWVLQEAKPQLLLVTGAKPRRRCVGSPLPARWVPAVQSRGVTLCSYMAIFKADIAVPLSLTETASPLPWFCFFVYFLLSQGPAGAWRMTTKPHTNRGEKIAGENHLQSSHAQSCHCSVHLNGDPPPKLLLFITWRKAAARGCPAPLPAMTWRGRRSPWHPKYPPGIS